jgi:hypothetical protein
MFFNVLSYYTKKINLDKNCLLTKISSSKQFAQGKFHCIYLNINLLPLLILDYSKIIVLNFTDIMETHLYNIALILLRFF